MKKFLSILLTLILTAGVVLSMAGVVLAQNNSNRVVDGADLLMSSEESMLEDEIAEWCDAHKFDIVIVTIESNLNDEQIQAYADDYYDYHDYGYGENYDGCLMVVDMGSRTVAMSTCGYGATVITDFGIENIIDEVCEYLGNEEYVDAFETGFFDNVKWMYDSAEDGDPYDAGDGDLSTARFDIAAAGGLLGMGLFPGALIAFVMARAQKNKLKTIRRKTEAQSYIRPGSLNITRSRERFLYSHVSRTAKPKDNGGSSGGSTMHTSSSGRSHGGGVGHF